MKVEESYRLVPPALKPPYETMKKTVENRILSYAGFQLLAIPIFL